MLPGGAAFPGFGPGGAGSLGSDIGLTAGPRLFEQDSHRAVLDFVMLGSSFRLASGVLTLACKGLQPACRTSRSAEGPLRMLLFAFGSLHASVESETDKVVN